MFLNRASEFKQQSQSVWAHTASTSTAADSSSTNYNKTYDGLCNFQPAAGKTLFICQACYSGNIVDDMAESKQLVIIMQLCTMYKEHANFVMHVEAFTFIHIIDTATHVKHTYTNTTYTLPYTHTILN